MFVVRRHLLLFSHAKSIPQIAARQERASLTLPLFRSFAALNTRKQGTMATDDAASDAAAAVQAPVQVSLLTLDRRAMEAERLARRQKAQEQKGETVKTGTEKTETEKTKTEKREQKGEPEKTKTEKVEKTEETVEELPPKRKAEVVVIDDSDEDVSFQGPPPRKRKLELGSAGFAGSRTQPVVIRDMPASTTSSAAKSTDSGSSSASLPFPEGVVKKTWMRGQPRGEDEITAEEVLQKDKLQMAIISSFQWDEEWMLKLIDVRRTKLMLVAFAADEDQKAAMQANVPNSNVRFCFPYVTPMTNMHSKLQVLKYDGYLRVVVPTGNFVPYDWGETGAIENTVFMIDLPRLPAEVDREATQTSFLDDLSYFLTAQNVDQSLVKSLGGYDFSKTARYGFVHTICGSHTGDAWERTGYCGLGRAVKKLGWAADSPVQVDYMCSSIGSVGDDILNALYYACQGDTGLKEYEARTNKSKKGKPVPEPDWRNKLRVYFPSNQTVMNSRGGAPSAGTICFQRNWWDSPKFPREILRDYENVRAGVLTHSKLLFVRQTAVDDKAWTYVGSANLSESAWGRLVKDRATKEMKITCRNWECGVLIPTSSKAEAAQSRSAPEGPAMLDAFKGTVPMPMVLPGKEYSGKGVAGIPWFFREV